MSEKKHFIALDGLRGVAALSVVVLHTTGPFGLSPFPSAGLAVDFFFALSGFVVAFAYEDRLRDGSLSVGGFLRARVERLHPLVAASVLFGAVIYGANYVLLEHGNPGVIALAALMGMFLIPFGGLAAGNPSSHPLNPPSWSLFAEYIANLAYALICKRLNTLALGVLVAVAAVIEGGLIVRFGTLEVGNFYSDWPLSLLRVIFPFFGGVALFRIWRRGAVRQIRVHFLLLSLALLVTFAMPQTALLDAAAVFLIFPLIITAGTHDIGWPVLNRVATWAGRLSYPLYVVHYPLVWVFSTIARKLGLSGPLLMGWIAIELIAMGVLAVMALKLYDEPVRRWLAAYRKSGKSPGS